MIRFVKTIRFSVLLICLLPWVVDGRVFRVVGDTRGRLNAVGLPWEMAYQTKMNVNGRKNDVVVYSARYSEPVAEQLKAQFERQGATVSLTRQPDGGALGIAKWDGGEARILVLAPEDLPNNLVFIFYPEPGEPRVPKSPIPDYPRGRITNTVANEDTKAFCTTFATLDSSMQVQRYYAEALARDGWQPVLPLRLSGGMSYFHKKESTCCVLAKEQEGGETLVTVLVRD